ncbi:hypothetical protein ASG81_04280 [Paenibacillus sp. Soil522]|nr:hypothetical protein ASG81_04280 [Paenibacillus sp. Soil522]
MVLIFELPVVTKLERTFLVLFTLNGSHTHSKPLITPKFTSISVGKAEIGVIAPLITVILLTPFEFIHSSFCEFKRIQTFFQHV